MLIDPDLVVPDKQKSLIYGCIEATRYCDTLNLRALASRWLRDGAAGIYLYNFFTMGQLLSMPMIIGGIIIYFIRKKQYEQS